MTSELRAAQFRFCAFVRSRWPPLRIPETTLAGKSAGFMCAANWIEALFWLKFGVELNAFPIEPAATLITKSRSIFEWISLEYASELGKTFPPVLIHELGFILAAGGLKLETSEHFDGSVLTHFQTALQLSNSMNRDLLGLSFRRLLAFADASTWGELIEGPCSIEVVNRWLLKSPADVFPSTEGVVAGLLKCTDAMVSWRLFFDSLMSDIDLPASAKSQLKRRIGLITSWTLNLHIGSIKDRFLQAVKASCTVLEDVSNHLHPHALIKAQAFRKNVVDLVEDWQSSHPHHLHAIGSA